MQRFTFQYEKINTHQWSTEFKIRRIFTFQYEKINTASGISYKLHLQIFTFQYEKINTTRAEAAQIVVNLFTFQYEKINTYVIKKKDFKKIDLHSNMKRLIPAWCTSRAGRYTWFTFQYEKINTSFPSLWRAGSS